MILLLGHQYSIPLSFLSKRATTFFKIKNRCSTLHYIFKRSFTLKLITCYNFNKTHSKKNEEILAYVINFPIYKLSILLSSYILQKIGIKLFRNQIDLLFHFET